MLSQLRAAEKRIMSFYSKETKDIKSSNTQKYFVCQFCGYISTEKPPEICRICGASKNGFQEVG
jgi:rubrerythrin